MGKSQALFSIIFTFFCAVSCCPARSCELGRRGGQARKSLIIKRLAFVPNACIAFHGLEANSILELLKLDIEEDDFPPAEIVLELSDLFRVGSSCELGVNFFNA